MGRDVADLYLVLHQRNVCLLSRKWGVIDFGVIRDCGNRVLDHCFLLGNAVTFGFDVRSF